MVKSGCFRPKTACPSASVAVTSTTVSREYILSVVVPGSCAGAMRTNAHAVSIETIPICAIRDRRSLILKKSLHGVQHHLLDLDSQIVEMPRGRRPRQPATAQPHRP